MYAIASSAIPHAEPSIAKPSLRDGAAHGFYAGVTDALFSALLTLAHAPVLLFTILIHGSSIVSVSSQWFSATRATLLNRPLRLLGLLCGLQGMLLLILGSTLYATSEPGLLFASFVCVVSMLSLWVGNYASPLWHATWASSLPMETRLAHLSERNRIMTYASLVALTLCFLSLHVWQTRQAFVLLLLGGGCAKVCSALSLLRAYDCVPDQVPERSVTHCAVRAVNAAPSPLRPIRALCPFYFGFGLVAAYLFPHLSMHLKFSAQDIFLFTAIQLIGQIVVTTAIQRQATSQRISQLFFVALGCLTVIPFSWCLASSFTSWSLIFFIAGCATGALNLGVIQLLHRQAEPERIAHAQAYFTTITTFAMLLGGAVGIVVALNSSLAVESTFRVIFIASGLVRSLALIPAMQSHAHI